MLKLFELVETAVSCNHRLYINIIYSLHLQHILLQIIHIVATKVSLLRTRCASKAPCYLMVEFNSQHSTVTNVFLGSLTSTYIWQGTYYDVTSMKLFLCSWFACQQEPFSQRHSSSTPLTTCYIGHSQHLLREQSAISDDVTCENKLQREGERCA